MSDHPFAHFLRILGKGPKSRRALTIEESQQAIQMVLDGEVTDKQLGAFLLLMRANGETPEELIGFVSGIRSYYGLDKTRSSIDLDISAYAGKWRYPPYFLLSVKLLIENSYKVLLHGDSGQFNDRHYAEAFMHDLGFEIADSIASAQEFLKVGKAVYLPLIHFAPELKSILHLKSEIGVRTVFNTAVKVLNPLNAPYAMQGIFHKGVENLHHAAAQANNTNRNMVFKGEGGEPEIRPDAFNRLFISEKNNPELQSTEIKAVTDRERRPKEWQSTALLDLWQGKNDDVYGEHAVLSSAAAALLLMEKISFEEAFSKSKEMWKSRLQG